MTSSRKLGEDFLIKSENMTKTCIVDNHFADELPIYHSLVMDVFRNFQSGEKRTINFRVWIDNQLNEEYFQKVLDTPVEENDTLESWSYRIFGDKKFGMIITHVETSSTTLCKKLLDKLELIIDQTQIPSGGFDIALFVGNYGWTPLGVHKDLNGGRVIHFHLGPGKKVMYQWEDSIYQELTNNEKNYQFPEKIVEHASKFEFEAGDLYFMNEQKWHIGYASDLSAGLAFWFNHFDRGELIAKLNFYIKDKLLVDKHLPLPSFKSISQDPQAIEFPLRTDNPSRVVLEQFYQELYKDYQLEMLSNGGFYQPGTKISGFTDLRLEHFVRSMPPFKIQYKQHQPNFVTLFVRAHQITFPFHEKLPNLLEKLNSGQTFQIQVLGEPLLEDWADEIVLHLINLLYIHTGVEIMESDQSDQAIFAITELQDNY